MHEVTMMRNVVDAVLEQAMQHEGSSIGQVRLVIEASDHLSEEGVRQLFAMLAANTPAAQAIVDVAWEPAQYQCILCRQIFPCDHPTADVTCPHCGGMAMPVSHSVACKIASIQVL